MKTVARMLVLALVSAALLLGGCSGSGGKDASQPPTDGSVGNEGGGGDGTGTGDGPVGGPVGAPCDKDEACQSSICYEQKCAKACTAPTDCNTGQDCTTDDGQRLFCHDPTYNQTIGNSCAVTGTCTGTDMLCVRGKLWAQAYCTAECKTDVDCPADLYCREFDDGKRYCWRRGFCYACHHDANCGGGKKCVAYGGGKFCTKTCNPGTTECPRFAECKNVNGENVCTHKSGSCSGDGTLCKPCFSDECATPGICLVNPYTDEQFCGQDCTSKGCPTKFDCATIAGDPTDYKQCVPEFDTSTEIPTMLGCVNISGTGEKGDVMDDFAMVGYIDSNNDGSLKSEKLRVVRLSDFASTHKIILFTVSAGWCGPCLSEAKTSAALMQTYGAQGLMVFAVLFETDQHTPPTQAFLDTWVNAANPAGVCGIDPYEDSIIYNTAASTPLNMLIDAKTLKVLEKFNGYSQASVESMIKTHLGI